MADYQTPVRTCKKHKQELVVYCFDCRKLCCLEGLTKDHQGHTCKSVSDAAREVRSGTLYQIKRIQENTLPHLHDKLVSFESNESVILANNEALKEDSIAVEKEIIDILRGRFAEKRSRLSEELKAVNETKQRIETSYKDIEKKTEYMKSNYLLASDAHFLELNDELQDSINNASLFKTDVPVYSLRFSSKMLTPADEQVLTEMVDNLCPSRELDIRDKSFISKYRRRRPRGCFLVTAIVIGQHDIALGCSTINVHVYERDPLQKMLYPWFTRPGRLTTTAPTSVLFKPDKTFHSFGYKAEKKYSELEEDNRHDGWYYFRGVNIYKGLQKQRDINGKEMETLEVFSEIFRFMRDRVLDNFDRKGFDIGMADFFWVLVASAFSTDAHLQILRNAAVKAGFDEEKLTMCLEPEAAFMYFMHLPKEDLDVPAEQAFPPGSKHLVLDCGYETVKATVHEVKEDMNWKELFNLSTGPLGMKNVEEEFINMLTQIVGKHAMKKFQTEHEWEFTNLLETAHVTFNHAQGNRSEKISFHVPIILREIFEETTDGDVMEVVKRSNFAGKITWYYKLRVTLDIVESFFSVVSEKIVSHVENAISSFRGIDKILMVGSFSVAPILQEIVKSNFEKKKIRVIVSQDGELSALKGAVLFGHRLKEMLNE